MYGRQFEPLARAPSWLTLGTRKECYKNSAHLALNNSEVQYTEGYALDLVDLPIPMEHAWVVDPEGKVIDPTWPESQNTYYFGVSFELEFLSSMLSKANGATGLLADPVLMRSHFGTPELFEKGISGAVRGR